MVKLWIACVLLVLAGGSAAFLTTEGKLWGLSERLGLGEREAASKPGEPDKVAGSRQGGQQGPEAKGGAGEGKGRGSQSVAVEAATAVATTSTQDLSGIGTLQSDESVQISSEIAGRVTELALSEGAPAAAGDILVRLDDALAVAELDDAQARYNLAQSNLERANSLAKSGNVTERARDEASTNAETSRAALELAKVRLSKHVIRAPFGGTAGMRKISPGAYITAGQPIVNLEKIDRLKIDFKLPELYLAQVANGQTIEITVDALPGRVFAGTIYAIDPHMDINGRALSIRARLDNPELVLRPGLFARIRVKGQVKRNVLVVPEAAIVPRGQDKIVYMVRDGQAVEAKVTIGNRSNGLVEILDGLAEDTMVVTAGQQMLRDGSRVEIVVGSNPSAKGT